MLCQREIFNGTRVKRESIKDINVVGTFFNDWNLICLAMSCL